MNTISLELARKKSKWTEEMINILEKYWDKDILDSEGRKYNEVKNR